MGENLSLKQLQLWNLCDFGIPLRHVHFLAAHGFDSEKLVKLDRNEFGDMCEWNRSNLYDLVQGAIGNGYPESFGHLSIWVLNAFGLSDSLTEKCHMEGLSLYKAIHMSQKVLMKKYGFSNSTSFKIKHCTEALSVEAKELVEATYEEKLALPLLKRKCIEVIEKSGGIITLFFLKQGLCAIPEANQPGCVEQLIQELAADKWIEITVHGIRLIEDRSLDVSIEEDSLDEISEDVQEETVEPIILHNLEDDITLDQLLLWNLCAFGVSDRIIAQIFDCGLDAKMLLTITENSLQYAFNRAVHSIYTKIQEALLQGFEASLSEPSIFILMHFGVTKKIAEDAREAGLSLENAILLPDYEISSVYNLSRRSAEKLKEAISQMPESIKQNLLGVNLEELQQIQNRVITLEEFFKTIPNQQEREMLELRLRGKGKTLEEIGTEYVRTRERVRQLNAKALAKRPNLFEDRYKEQFEKYGIDREDFIYIFNIPQMEYNYLNIAYEQGTLSVEVLMDDTSLSNDIRKRAYQVHYKDYFTDTEYPVRKRKNSILEYIIHTKCKSARSYDEIYADYVDFVSGHINENIDDWLMSESYYSNAISEASNAIVRTGRLARYYDYTQYDYENLFDALQLEKHKDIEYSTLKFFDGMPDLMKEYDIQNEYELHNLLKRMTGDKYPSLSFGRMPMLEFGKANRKNQLVRTLIGISPVSVDDFAESLYRDYGYSPQTAKGTFMQELREYLVDGEYRIDTPALNPLQLELISAKLEEEFYWISELEAIFDECNISNSKQYLNHLNISKLGYRLGADFIYKDCYTSAHDYFVKLFTKDEIVDIAKWGGKYTLSQSYYITMNQLKRNYDILEFSRKKYINFSKLKQYGVTKEALDSFGREVVDLNIEGYFTLQSIQNQGFEHELFDLGFDDCFYSFLILNQPEVKAVSYNNTTIFRITDEPFTIADFLEYQLSSLRKIDIYDFEDLLFDEYGITKDLHELKHRIKQSTMYYDDIMEKAYIDYDEYYEEI